MRNVLGLRNADFVTTIASGAMLQGPVNFPILGELDLRSGVFKYDGHAGVRSGMGIIWDFE